MTYRVLWWALGVSVIAVWRLGGSWVWLTMALAAALAVSAAWSVLRLISYRPPCDR